MDIVRSVVAEQVAPLVILQEEIAEHSEARIDLSRTRERLRVGLAAFDPLQIIAECGDLTVPFVRATMALERAGLVSNREAAQARARRGQVVQLIQAWLSGDAPPYDRARVVAHLAAGIVAGAVLRRAGAEVRASVDLAGWRRSWCPCCGGSPDIAVRADTSRALICARCSTSWSTEELGCIGCGARSAPTLGRIAAEQLDYALTICNSCGRYLKECGARPAVDPLVERTLTAELDAVAWRRGLRL